MQNSKLISDDFPDSPYALELTGGIHKLEFATPIEAEYALVHLCRIRLRVRIWCSFTFAVACLVAAQHWRQLGLVDPISLASLLIVLPSVAVLTYLAWTRHYERFYVPAARILIPLYSITIAILIAVAFRAGDEETLAVLTSNLMALSFFTGLQFRPALLSSVVMLVTFAFAACLAGVAPLLILKIMCILSLQALISNMVHRDIEKSYRRNFLEGQIIGELVARDGLSGLMNRRAFDEHLIRVWKHALRDHRSIAIIMIDIDHFKRFNDSFGHQAGDSAIRAVAKIIQGLARRPLDLAARYGGEEFAVILYDLALPNVQDIAERLRATVQNTELFVHADRAGIASGVTVSVGIALCTPSLGRNPKGAVQLADEALYEAKEAGRNLIVAKGAIEYMSLDTGAFKRKGKSVN